jgi:hypothetical protein
MREEKELSQKDLDYLEKKGLTGLINKRDVDSVKKIARGLSGTGLMSAGITLSGGNAKTIMKTQMLYQAALVEQNWIMIRQMNRIEKILRILLAEQEEAQR